MRRLIVPSQGLTVPTHAKSHEQTDCRGTDRPPSSNRTVEMHIPPWMVLSLSRPSQAVSLVYTDGGGTMALVLLQSGKALKDLPLPAQTMLREHGDNQDRDALPSSNFNQPLCSRYPDGGHQYVNKPRDSVSQQCSPRRKLVRNER